MHIVNTENYIYIILLIIYNKNSNLLFLLDSSTSTSSGVIESFLLIDSIARPLSLPYQN